jgi:hypothetical protein
MICDQLELLIDRRDGQAVFDLVSSGSDNERERVSSAKRARALFNQLKRKHARPPPSIDATAHAALVSSLACARIAVIALVPFDDRGPGKYLPDPKTKISETDILSLRIAAAQKGEWVEQWFKKAVSSSNILLRKAVIASARF